MSWLLDLSAAPLEAARAARARLTDPDAPAGTRHLGGTRWVTPSRELVDQVTTACPDTAVENLGAQPELTAGGGAYHRDNQAVWRYVATGDPVPGAQDLTLATLYPDLEQVDDEPAVHVPDQLVASDEDLAWVRDVAAGPTERDTTAQAPSHSPTPGWSTVWTVPLAEWQARAHHPVGMLAPELHAEYMLDLHGLTSYLDMGYQTVRDYRGRGQLPEPQAYAGGSPLWARPVIDHWHHHWPRRRRSTKNE